MLLRRNRLTRGLGAAALGLALGLALAACDASVEIDAAPESSPASRSPTTSPSAASSSEPTSPTPSESATPTPSPTPSETATPTSAGPVRLPDRLLTGEEMPGFNELFTWEVARTRTDEGAEPFGTCHKFAMTSIGAVRVMVREYEPARPSEGSSAGHLVAEFADRTTARRAYDVLRSWRDTCDAELGEYDRRKVHPFEPVSVPEGDGGWYLLVYGPPEDGLADEGYFDAQGLTLVGKRISVLEMRLIGQDYNYPSGKEPMVTAVRTAARKLA